MWQQKLPLHVFLNGTFQALILKPSGRPWVTWRNPKAAWKNNRKTKIHEERTWLFHHKFHLMFLIGFCVCCSSPPFYTSILQEVFFFLTTSLPVSDLTIQYTHNGWGNFSFCYVVFLLRKSETLVTSDNPPLPSLNIPSGDETNACCSQSPKNGFCRHPYGVVVPSSFQKKSCENCYERSHIIYMYHILVYIDIVVHIMLHFPQKSNVHWYWFISTYIGNDIICDYLSTNLALQWPKQTLQLNRPKTKKRVQNSQCLLEMQSYTKLGKMMENCVFQKIQAKFPYH